MENNNEYLDKLVKELEAQGVVPENNSTKLVANNQDDRELKIILDMEKATGREFSDEQKKILMHHGNACILACAGSGKALVNGTGVLTPNGYRPIETLKVGDKVFDENGHIQRVIGVYPQGKKLVFKIKFMGGEVIECCEDHLWTVEKDGYWQTFNTKTLVDLLNAYKVLKIPSVNGSADNFIYNDINREYIETLRNMLPSRLKFFAMYENECDRATSILQKTMNTLGYTDDVVEFLHNMYIINSNNTIQRYKNEELKNIVKLAYEFFGASVKERFDEDKKEYMLTFDNELYDFMHNKYITDIEVTDEYKEMTCISVTGKSNLYLTEHCIATHNTTVSVNLIAKRLMTGEIRDAKKLIYTTYSKAGATEMKERLDSLLRQLGMEHINVQVRTIHSFFLQVLRTFGVSADIIKNETRTQFVKKACKEANFTPKDDDLMIIDNLLSYQVNNLLSDKKTIESYVNTLEDLTLNKYSIIRKSYASQKGEKGVIDYDDMQSFLYLWLVKYAKSDNPQEVEIATSVRNYCKAMWTDFYIDEAQDVSKIQFEIIKAMVTDPTNPSKLDKGLVFIGDDDQCIYQWRGSDPHIILTISARFDIPTFVLSTNYRCLNEIVDYSATGIKHNNSRYNKGMTAFNNGGTVKIAPCAQEDLCSLSVLALNHIKWWISQGNKISDIAVLSRNNFHLALLSNMLLREGIYCNMTEDMKLTNSYMYKDVKDIIALSETNWKSELTSRILWKLCRYLSTNTSRIIANFQDTCALSLEDTLGWIVKNFINKDISFNKRLGITLQAEEQMKYYMSRLSNETMYDIEIVYNSLKNTDRADVIRNLLYQYLNASSFMYKSEDKNRSITGLVKYIINLIIKDGVDNMLEFLRVTEQLESGRMVIPGEKLTLTTIHSAKGREWKNVIMFACDNVSQPSFSGIYRMIQDEISMSDIFSNIDEERRLFYVGNTRAKENLLVITYSVPSVFVLEALGAFKDNTGNNATIVGLVSDDKWAEHYKDYIIDNIFNPDSKYYYNTESHKVQGE